MALAISFHLFLSICMLAIDRSFHEVSAVLEFYDVIDMIGQQQCPKTWVMHHNNVDLKGNQR
jgi:hypothetical protein